MIRPGTYLTENNREARVYGVFSEYLPFVAWVKGFGNIAYNLDGTPVADVYIPQAYNIKLETWQALPEKSEVKV